MKPQPTTVVRTAGGGDATLPFGGVPIDDVQLDSVVVASGSVRGGGLSCAGSRARLRSASSAAFRRARRSTRGPRSSRADGFRRHQNCRHALHLLRRDAAARTHGGFPRQRRLYRRPRARVDWKPFDLTQLEPTSHSTVGIKRAGSAYTRHAILSFQPLRSLTVCGERRQRRNDRRREQLHRQVDGAAGSSSYVSLAGCPAAAHPAKRCSGAL